MNATSKNKSSKNEKMEHYYEKKICCDKNEEKKECLICHYRHLLGTENEKKKNSM